jgi:hypothetical protein
MMAAFVCSQATLGALVVMSGLQPIINTAHVVNGALVLGTSLVLTLRTWRPASSFELPASSFELPASSSQLPAPSFQCEPRTGEPANPRTATREPAGLREVRG